MIQAEIDRLVPAFLRNDRNGNAAARALEAGMTLFFRHVQTGIDVTMDVDKMPEWRLDEMAWELQCLYDYNASIENKRNWIRNAVSDQAGYGTAASMREFLSGYFNDVDVQEAKDYDGEPFHFRVTVDGSWYAEKEALVRKAIAETKNVRSVLDSIAVGGSAEIIVEAETDYIRYPYLYAGEEVTGTLPE